MNLKVLLIEDEKILAKLLAAYLTEEGIHTVNAKSAADALNMIRSENFDIAITDISLPDTSGDKLIPELADIRKDLKFIITTGDSSYEVPEELLAFGVNNDSVMHKPFSAASILKKIRSMPLEQ